MSPTREVCAGPVAALPEDAATPVGDGAAVVVRSGPEVRAFTNRCAHQDSPLAGGWVRDGVLTCPQHFWRFATDDGHVVGPARAGEGLERLGVRVEDGRAFVALPEAPPPMSLREQLLARARTYDRDRAYQQAPHGPADRRGPCS